MPPNNLFADDPDSTREAIMAATYRALCRHGYADLTIQRIGDEFEKSKSLLYHHYDGKDALLVDFLRYMLERFEAEVGEHDESDALVRLRGVVDRTLPRTLDDERAEFSGAMFELRSQATQDAAYREQFTRSDRFLRERLATIVRDGVEQGVFRDVDPERTAAFLFATLNGAMLARTTADDDAVEAVRAELDAYVESHLLADGVTTEAGVRTE